MMLGKCGLQTPPPQNLPPIVYHDPMSTFVGETMEAAARAGSEHFGVKPQIIFVLLPNTSTQLHMNLPAEHFIVMTAYSLPHVATS